MCVYVCVSLSMYVCMHACPSSRECWCAHAQVCSYVCLCTVCTYVYSRLWRMSSSATSSLFFETRPLDEPGVIYSATKLQRETCPHLPCTGTTDMHHSHGMYMSARIWTQVLMLVREALANWAISPAGMKHSVKSSLPFMESEGCLLQSWYSFLEGDLFSPVGAWLVVG